MIKYLDRRHIDILHKMVCVYNQSNCNSKAISELKEFLGFFLDNKLKKKPETFEIPMPVICDVVCEYFKTTPFEIFQDTRERPYCVIRQRFYYLVRYFNLPYKLSSAKIGRYYSDISGVEKDHASVLHSAKVIENLIAVDRKEAEILNDLKMKIIVRHKENLKT